MPSEITPFERKALGVLAFVVCAVPVCAVVFPLLFAMLVTIPEWLFLATFIAFAIAVGSQFPLFTILAEVAGGRVPASEQSPFARRFRHPFSLFEFWWRYVRQ